MLLFQHFSNSLPIVLVTILISGASYQIIKGLINKRKKQIKKPNYPRDLVILHQFPRGLRAPSPTPFPLKLETWLRMTGINYENDFTMELSAKGKMPWITFNNQDISDSQICIEFLMKEFNKDLSNHLSPSEKGIARAFLKMTEESLRWVITVHKFKYGKPEDTGIRMPIFELVGSKMLKESLGQGYGRHSMSEVHQIGIEDIRSLEDFIADKKFLMGDQVCNEDASIFGHVAQLINHDRGPLNKFLINECPNLLKYYERMKQLYWPDWNKEIRENKN